MARWCSKVDHHVDAALGHVRTSVGLVRLMVRLSNLGTYSIIWLAAGVAAYAATPSHRTTLAVFIAAVPLEFALTNGPVKALFRRVRPPIVPREALRLPRTSSFPSGHSSAASMAVVALASTGLPGLGAAVVGGLIALSRVFLRLHHASDVVGGLLWGLFLGILVRILASVV